LARQRNRLARLAVAAAAVLATAALVHGTGAAFTSRLGQRPDREIRVHVDQFMRRNQIKTNAARQVEADKVAATMVNDPAPIRDLAERLDDLVSAIAKAPRLEALPESVRATWALTATVFEDLKAATDTPERRDDLHRQIAQAFAPLIRDGVLGPDALPRHEEASRTLAVHLLGQSAAEAHAVPRERVVPERLAKPEGPVYSAFLGAFTDPRVGPILFRLVADKLAGTPTLTYEEAYTTGQREQARARVADVYDTYRHGDVLVEQGQEIGEEQLTLLRMEHDTANAALGVGARARRAGAVIVLVAALFALLGVSIARREPEVAGDLRRLASLCGLIVAAIGLVRLLAMQPWDAELIPVAITAMILAIAYTPHFALRVTFALGLLTSLALGAGISHFLVLMGGTAAGVLTLDEVRTRTKLIKVGAAAALGYFVLTWATGLWQDQPIGLVAADSFWRAGWGLMAGFFLGGSLPFIETSFGIVTGISLLELGDVTHPLLQELVCRAPGTHNHSITVGAIAESAAERIGAHALLVRIGAYFHDIGKMLKPHYFIENQVDATNRHANLAPAMSTLIIIGHVKDGVDLGRQHHLPEPIINLIEQHHGTTLVEYFYHEANRRNGGNPDAASVQESAFRYPGPKPQTKEAGILMVADAVESASRTLSEPTPARLEGLVRDLIEKRLRDGQFDECGLTLSEISEIRDSLIKSLIGIYHGRVKYPEQRTA
jgi:putative nucleotidyltransferase with HDIG domain